MPLEWRRPPHCYACNAYARLGLAANATAVQIAGRGKKLLQRLARGMAVQCRCGHELDEREVQEAVSALVEPASQAEELLLVHPPFAPPAPPAEGDKIAVPEVAPQPLPLPLRDALARLWLVPPPESPTEDSDLLFDV